MSRTIGVAGATGALGKEIVAVLDEAPWRPAHIIPLASASTAVSFVDYGKSRVAVDDLADQAMEDLDALILAVPSDVAEAAGERAIAEGIPVIDASGLFAATGRGPLVVPWVNPEALAELPPEGVLSLPGPAALLIASVLAPLRRAGVAGEVEATVLLPASVWGRAGIDELSAQVVALFNSGTPARKVFPDGLAFDLLPQIGSLDESGWTLEERKTTLEVARLLGGSLPVTVTEVAVPVFTGISATIRIRTAQQLDPALVERILADGGVQLPKAPGVRYLPRPRRVDGKAFVQVGRIRRDPGGTGLHLWASLDNLRGTAAAAVAATGALLKRYAEAD